MLSAEVRIYVDQPQHNICYFKEINLAVNIEGLTAEQALRGYRIHLDFDDNYLEAAGLSAFSEGPFLKGTGLTQWYVIEEDGGYTASCAILDYTPGATGSGTLFYVTLKAKDQATGSEGTDVTLSDIILRDPLNHPITADVIESANIVIHPGVMIYVEPAADTLYYYQSVTLAVKIEGSEDLSLRGYQIHLDFDDTYLEVTGTAAFTQGPYLSGVGLTQWYVLEEDGGYTVTCSILDYTQGAFNSGTLFYVTLTANDQSTGPEGTDILLSDIILRDPLNHNIDYTYANGNIVIEAPQYIYTGLKVYLQGPYLLGTGGTMRHALFDLNYIPLTSPYDPTLTLTALPAVAPRYIVDWIYVQLRASATGPFEQPQSCFLLNDGTVVDINGSPDLAFEYTGGIEYYTVVRHRNHLAVMSAVPATFSSDPLHVTIADLTVLDSVYGGNQYGVDIVEPSVLALCAGDADQDLGVLPRDNNEYWRMQTGLFGYKSADFDLDGWVLPNDRNDYWRLNTGKLSQIPSVI